VFRGTACKSDDSPVVRVSLASACECTVGPRSCSAGPGRGGAVWAVTGDDVGDADGVPAVRVGY